MATNGAASNKTEECWVTMQVSVWLGTKPPFRSIFQVAANRADAEVRITNEPLGMPPRGRSVFQVEAGETRSLPQTQFAWLKSLVESQTIMNR
jgi:hypothetical protein